MRISSFHLSKTNEIVKKTTIYHLLLFVVFCFSLFIFDLLFSYINEEEYLFVCQKIIPFFLIRFDMPLSNNDSQKEFLEYLNQPDSCELFYLYMKSEKLAYVLEFYLACDGLKNLTDNIKNQCSIIKLIYKHYLSHGKLLSSSKVFSLPEYIHCSIKERLIKHEYHIEFYDQAQEYVLKYMLQRCYPKFLTEQQNLSKAKRQVMSTTKHTPMRHCAMSVRKKDVFEKLKQPSNLPIIIK